MNKDEIQQAEAEKVLQFRPHFNKIDFETRMIRVCAETDALLKSLPSARERNTVRVALASRLVEALEDPEK